MLIYLSIYLSIYMYITLTLGLRVFAASETPAMRPICISLSIYI